MSENVFGRWKNRFPILRQLRVFLPLAQEIILGTAILCNIAFGINEPDMEGDRVCEDEDEVEDPMILVQVEDNIRRQLVKRKETFTYVPWDLSSTLFPY